MKVGLASQNHTCTALHSKDCFSAQGLGFSLSRFPNYRRMWPEGKQHKPDLFTASTAWICLASIQMKPFAVHVLRDPTDSCGFTSSLQLHQEHPYPPGLLHRTMLFTSLDSLFFCFGSCYIAIRLHIYYNIFCIYCLLYMYCKHTNAVDTLTNKIIQVYKSVYRVGFGFSPSISLELADRAFL